LRRSQAENDRLAAWRDTCDFGPTARLMPTENLHVTLYFLGDVSPAAIAELRSAAAALPFTAGISNFASPRSGRAAS
jgi:2'-5' RNA ligase